MSGPLVHLDTGLALVPLFAGLKEFREDHFLSGNLMPDAAHARQPFDRDHKRRAHLKHGFLDSQLSDPAVARLWDTRIKAFGKRAMEFPEPERSCRLGWVCHLLADRSFLTELRLLVEDRWVQRGLPRTGIRAPHYYEAMDEADSLALSRRPELEAHAARFTSLEGPEVAEEGEGAFCVTTGESRISRAWVASRFTDRSWFRTPSLLDSAEIDAFRTRSIACITSTLQEWGLGI